MDKSLSRSAAEIGNLKTNAQSLLRCVLEESTQMKVQLVLVELEGGENGKEYKGSYCLGLKKHP